ncbi:hypothetical protein AAHE18_19G218200 [Arachis hypogaea]
MDAEVETKASKSCRCKRCRSKAERGCGSSGEQAENTVILEFQQTNGAFKGILLLVEILDEGIREGGKFVKEGSGGGLGMMVVVMVQGIRNEKGCTRMMMMMMT